MCFFKRHLVVKLAEAWSMLRTRLAKSIRVLVATTSFARKLLGGVSSWDKTFKERKLSSLLVDEANQDSFLKLSSLVCRSEHQVVLFGDALQEHMAATQGESFETLSHESGFGWARRARIPTVSLPVTFR